MRDFITQHPVLVPSHFANGKYWHDLRRYSDWALSMQVCFDASYFGMRVLAQVHLDVFLLQCGAKPYIASYLLGADTMRDANFNLQRLSDLDTFAGGCDIYDSSNNRLAPDGSMFVIGCPSHGKVHGLELDVLWLSDFVHQDRELTAYLLDSQPCTKNL